MRRRLRLRCRCGSTDAAMTGVAVPDAANSPSSTGDEIPPIVEGSVALMYCTRGDTRFEFTQSVLGLTQAKETDGRIAYVLGRIASGNLAVHRNEVVMDFLATPAEFLWFVDDDMQFADDTLAKLLEVHEATGCRVVGGLYSNVGLDGGIIPMAYHLTATNRVQAYSAWNIVKQLDAGAKSLLIYSTGAGCLLIHRSVLEAMVERYGLPMPCFANEIHPDSDGKLVVQGEDHTFFRRLHSMGIEAQLRLDVDVTHFKMIALTTQHLRQTADASPDPSQQENPT